MTQEEKAKAYDEIIKKANKMHHENCEACQACIEELIPELTESEDERIRKSLIIFLQHFCKGYRVPGLDFPISYKDMLAWVERQGEHANFINKIKIGDKVTRNEDGVLVNLSQLKRVAKKDEAQGEQKPTEWSSEQRKTLQTDVVLYESSPDAHLWTRAIGFDGVPMESKPCEQKSSWSEDDENNINSIVSRLEVDISYWESRSKTRTNEDKKLIEWLKFLKDRYTWKLSDEQMDALHYVTNFDYGGHKATLVSLYEQLKKLKE